MKHKLFRTLFVLMLGLFFCQTYSFAQEPTLLGKYPVKAWNKELNQIETNFEKERTSIESLDTMIDRISNYQIMAEECLEESNSEIERVNNALKTDSSTADDAAKNIGQKPSMSGEYANKLKSNLLDLQKECKLFLLRSNDTSAKLKKIQDQLTTSYLLSRKTSLWDEVKALSQFSQVHQDNLIAALTLKKTTPFESNLSRYLFVVILAIAGLAGYFIRKLCSKALSAYSKFEIKKDFFAILNKYSYLLSYSFALCLFFLTSNIDNLGLSYYSKISIAFLGYILICTLMNFIFHPPRPAQALVILPGAIPRLFNQRVFYLNTLIFLAAIIYFTLSDHDFPQPFVDLTVTVFLTLISISLMSIIWVVTRIPKLFYDWMYIKNFLNIVFTLFMLATILAEWIGYHNVALYLIQNLALTILIVFSTWTIHIAIRRSFLLLESNGKVRSLLGVRITRSIYEFYLINITLLVIVWTVAFTMLLNLWIFSEVYFDKIQSALIHGFHFVSLSVAPGRIVIALLTFSILSLLSRWIQNNVSVRSSDYIEEGAQVAVGTIVGYIGFVVALLVALIIAGVNFTGLAIIAGALSVGIGFGLQNIANDFISGLILLVETPIKPGDRVMIGDVEGYVKRIRLRATQITTLNKSDIFIPNSEMISQHVVNYMFRNQRWRVDIKVGVAYGSDVELVRKVLTDIAYNHPDIENQEPNSPEILFRQFADSSLLFEMRCIISNANKMYSIESDLHFAIDKAFKEHNITIPFPQRDLHIKTWKKPEEDV